MRARKPRSMPKAEGEELIRAFFPEAEEAARIIGWLRPALVLVTGSIDPAESRLVSRFGGHPMAPAGFQWPCYNDEPMLHMAQINLAEFAGIEAAKAQPRDGWLAFFADPDIATGCDGSWGEGEDCAVFHFPADATLVKAEPPEPDIEIMPECAIAPHEVWEIPDSSSHLTGHRFEEKSFWLRYGCLHDHLEVSPLSSQNDNWCKLLGWANLVQARELEAIEHDGDSRRLLLQISGYDTGPGHHAWGPGGNIYFTIDEKELAVGDFSRVVFEGQHT